MKTDDLIKAIAADAKSVEPPIAHTIAMAVGAGALISAFLFLWALGMRDNFVESIATSLRFVFKFVLTLSVAIPSFFLVRELSRPDFRPEHPSLRVAHGAGVLLALLSRGPADPRAEVVERFRGTHDLEAEAVRLVVVPGPGEAAPAVGPGPDEGKKSVGRKFHRSHELSRSGRQRHRA